MSLIIPTNRIKSASKQYTDEEKLILEAASYINNKPPTQNNIRNQTIASMLKVAEDVSSCDNPAYKTKSSQTFVANMLWAMMHPTKSKSALLENYFSRGAAEVWRRLEKADQISKSNKSGTRLIDNPDKSYTKADVNDTAKNISPKPQSLIDEKTSDCIARVKVAYPGISNPEGLCSNIIQGDNSDTEKGTKAAQLSFKSEKECIGHLVQRGSTPQSAQSQCAKIFSDTEDQQELPSENIGEGPEMKQSTRTISMSDGRGGGGNSIVTTKMPSANKLRAEGKTIKSASDMSTAKMVTIFDSYYSTGGYQDKSQSIKSASEKDKLNWLRCEIRTQQRHNGLNKSDDIPSRTHSASTRPAWQVLSEKASALIDSHRS